MDDKTMNFHVSENDALSLEYKLYERGTLRHLDVADVINDTSRLSVVGPDEGSLEEQRFRFLGVNVGSLNDDVGD